MKAKFLAGFTEILPQQMEWFAPWTFETPLVISAETHAKLERVQKLMYRSVLYYVNNYERYRKYAPVSEAVERLLEIQGKVPYEPGTYRTDFIIDTNNHIKLIEITCRYAFNGFFITGFFRGLLNRYLAAHPEVTQIDCYSGFWDYVSELFGGVQRYCVLKGVDNKNDSRYYSQILRTGGYEVHEIAYDAITSSLHLFNGALVLPELSQEEILGLHPEVIHAMIEARHINDLRTVFLIHDKRFFSALSHGDFLREALPSEDAEFFEKFLLPSFGGHERPDIWESARKDKNNWIIKNRALGMGQEIFAGAIMPEAEWEQVITQTDLSELTIQQYIQQRRFNGRIGEKVFNDFVTGTLLFLNDNYFGPGLFRSSSHPITNLGDNRKVMPLITADTQYFSPDNIL